jgi:hypothetical protein
MVMDLTKKEDIIKFSANKFVNFDNRNVPGKTGENDGKKKEDHDSLDD